MARSTLINLGLLVAFAIAGPGRPDPLPLPVITREEIIATAKTIAQHKWRCREANLQASCVHGYRSDWKADQVVTGLPYNWGGIDSPEAFEKKLAQGMAAGAHSRDGITKCTAGIDCSGFVAMCWGRRGGHDLTTRNIRSIAGRPKYNWFSEMKPGDAFVKPGSHIVLFAGYNTDGTPNVYEASGSAARVILTRSSWSRFRTYFPLQYKMVAEEQ